MFSGYFLDPFVLFDNRIERSCCVNFAAGLDAMELRFEPIQRVVPTVCGIGSRESLVFYPFVIYFCFMVLNVGHIFLCVATDSAISSVYINLSNGSRGATN